MNYRSKERGQNKQPTSIYQRRFISPTELKGGQTESQTQKVNRIAEYGRRDGQKKSNLGSSVSSKDKNQKSKSRISQQASHNRSQKSQQKKISNTNHFERDQNGSNSKSKEKKDYMTVNLAKLTRKKQQKGSNQSQEHRTANILKKKPSKQSIYTGNEDSKISKEIQKSSFEDQNGNLSSKISQQIHYVDSNTKVNMKAAFNTKPIEENTVKPEEKINYFSINESQINNQKSKIKNQNQITPKQSNHINQQPSWKANLNESSTKRNSIDSDLTKMQLQLARGQDRKLVQQLMTQLNQQRAQAASNYKKIEGQKYELQTKYSKMVESQFQLQNQVQLLKTRNSQLQRDADGARDLVNKNGRETNQAFNNHQKMFKEMENKYNSLGQDYRDKIKQMTEYARQLSQNQTIIGQLEGRVRSLQQENRIKSQQMQKTKKIYEAKLLQTKQTVQYQIKELQIRFGGKNQQQQVYENNTKQLQKQIVAKNQEIQSNNVQIQHLQQQVKDKSDLQYLLKSKINEINGLVKELNYNKAQLTDHIHKNSQTTANYQMQLFSQKKTIDQLNQQIDYLKNYQINNRLQEGAKGNLYGTEKPQSTFQDLLQNQTQQTNKLRSQLFQKTDRLYELQSNNEELKDKLRKLQQQTQLTARTFTSNINNLKQAKEAGETMLRAELQNLKRKIVNLQGKIKDRQIEIDQKNKFIQQYLIGQNKKQDPASLLQKLQEMLKSK